MCGIAGIVNKSGAFSPDEIARLVRSMADSMAYRGPDDAGVWVDEHGYCGLSHRRLSIIDRSSAGHQPMLSESGRQAITYNGEFYSYLDLRETLSAQGVSFKTRCDTEVLLAGLCREGPALLPKIDAMFAFGLYDVETRELLIARDMFGEKPLYYVDHKDYFAFASELHALTLLPGFDARIEAESIAGYLSFQYLPGDQTIYAAARKLPPGSFLRVAPGRPLQAEQYYRFRTSGARQSERSLDDLADELEDILLTSLRRRLISDVPLGAFLSGGVDSTVVAALITRKLNHNLKTFSIGFSDHADSEHLQARETAEYLGTDHHERVLSPDTLDLGARIGAILDEPNADSSCLPTYLLSEFARESVTVILSGDGGDELFGGYGRYFATVDEDDRKRAGDAGLGWWHAGAVYFSNRILVYPDDVLSELFGEVPAGLAARLRDLRGAIDQDSRPLINVLREVDAGTYMPGAVLAKVDRMSMQHSLEVRAPLIGRDVALFAETLAASACYAPGQGKLVLKRVAERYVPKEWLARPKRGFGLPMDLWGRDQLLPLTRERLLAPDARLRNWIDPARLERFLTAQRGDFNAYRVWALFILENWMRHHPTGVAAPRPIAGNPMKIGGDSLFARARSLLGLSA